MRRSIYAALAAAAIALAGLWLAALAQSAAQFGRITSITARSEPSRERAGAADLSRPPEIRPAAAEVLSPVEPSPAQPEVAPHGANASEPIAPSSPIDASPTERRGPIDGAEFGALLDSGLLDVPVDQAEEFRRAYREAVQSD